MEKDVLCYLRRKCGSHGEVVHNIGDGFQFLNLGTLLPFRLTEIKLILINYDYQSDDGEEKIL